MTKIDRDCKIVVKFKGGASMNRPAREFKLKPLTVERIIRNWFHDVYEAAARAQGRT